GQLCNQNTGMCYDPCQGVTCPTGAVCGKTDGVCHDCFDLGYGCSGGKVCMAGTNGVGTCGGDKCAGVTCPAGQTCGADGNCAGVDCPSGCKESEVCDHGVCVAHCSVDVCFGVNCGDGMACNPADGRCIADPCDHTTCGSGDCVLTCTGSAT